MSKIIHNDDRYLRTCVLLLFFIRTRPPVASSRALSLFRADVGAKSLFLMSGCGVRCYAAEPAGGRSPLTASELALTASNARRRPRLHR